MHQSIPAAPCPTLPGLLRGICKFALPGGRAFANPELLTHPQFQRILLEKQADWLICQGREKIEEVWKGMFSILFIAYQARIT